MRKRLLALLMTIMLTFSLGTGIVAANAETSADSNNLAFAKALHLIDEDVTGETAFTRAQLAKLVCRLLFYQESTLEQITFENVFFDVSDADAPYVTAAVRAGILSGVGDNLFRPDENVTYIQLVTTMVRILGREEVAQTMGGYPSGYYMTASTLGITKYAPPNADYAINVNAVANILKQMVNCEMTWVDNTGELQKQEKNYLEYYCHIHYAKGVIDTVAGQNLHGASAEYDTLCIGEKEFTKISEKFISTDLLGCKAEAFYTTIEEDELLYVEAVNNEVLLIDAEDMISANQNGIRYYEDSRGRTADINIDTCVIYNGKAVTSYTAQTLCPFTVQNVDGNVKLVDNDGDSVYDVVQITAYQSHLVTGVSSDTAFCKNSAFTLNYDNLQKNTVTNILAQPIDTALIEVGDVLHVMKDADGAISRVMVSIDSLNGIISETEEDGTVISSITLDGTAFECAKGLVVKGDKSKIKAGEGAKVYFNPEGRICVIDTEGFDNYNIGYLIDAAATSGISTTQQMKLLTTGEGIQIYDLANKVAVTVGSGAEDVLSAKNAVAEAGETEGRVTRQPIYYTLNAEGKLAGIRYPDLESATTSDGFYQYPNFDGETAINNSNYYYRASSMSFGAKLLLKGSTKVFSVASEADRDDDTLYYMSSTSTFVSGNPTKKIEAYGTKANNPVADIVVIRATAGGAYTIDDRGNVFVIRSVASATDADGERAVRLKGICYGAEVDLLAKPEAAQGIVPGDIIKYTCNAKSVIETTEKIFSYEESKKENGAPLGELGNPSQSNLYTAARFSYGTVCYADDYAFTVAIANGEDTIYNSYPIAKFQKIVVDASNNKVEVYKGTDEPLLSSDDYGEQASKVFIHTENADCKTLVIYK